MNVVETMENDSVVVSVSGEIDGSNVKEFETALRGTLGKAPNLILDLKDLEYVSSAGLRVFLLIRKMSEGAGQTMTIKNVSDDVLSIFSVTGFVKLLNIE